VLFAVGILAASLWVFVELADEVVENETHAIDRKLLMMLRNPVDPSDPIGSLWVESAVRDVTALGSTVVLAFITFAAAGYLFLAGKPHAALFVLGAVLGGLLLGSGMKQLFGRPRPDFVAHGDHVLSASFPSNHSLMSAVVYLTLGALLARVFPSFRIKAYFLLLAVLLTLAVGVSRVYLGVHWPTDVLAGWALGAAWAIVCWLLARWLQRQGQVEKASE
jgi:undecaprenyl-diphosphatase